MCSKKKYIIFILFVLINSILAFRLIYINSTCVKLNDVIHKRDIRSVTLYSADDDDINNINKCNKLEQLSLSRINENQLAGIKKSNSIKELFVYYSTLHSIGIRNINSFNNLQTLTIIGSDIDFKYFNNKIVSAVNLYDCVIKSLNSLEKCNSLTNVGIMAPIVADEYIVNENSEYVLKDSSIFTSWNTVQVLGLSIDKIEDISGILEMDSLNEFKVNKNSISEEDVKSLENKGVTVTYCD